MIKVNFFIVENKSSGMTNDTLINDFTDEYDEPGLIPNMGDYYSTNNYPTDLFRVVTKLWTKDICHLFLMKEHNTTNKYAHFRLAQRKDTSNFIAN